MTRVTQQGKQTASGELPPEDGGELPLCSRQVSQFLLVYWRLATLDTVICYCTYFVPGAAWAIAGTRRSVGAQPLDGGTIPAAVCLPA